MTPAVSVELRRATESDLPAVTEMERACYSDPWPATAFASLPENKRVFFTVAEAGAARRIVGYAVAWYVMDEGELANLAVARSHRGQGVGSALLDATLRDAMGRGISQFYLEVRESNVRARRLYESRGFLEVTRRKGYYRSPVEDALILRRTLKP